MRGKGAAPLVLFATLGMGAGIGASLTACAGSGSGDDTIPDSSTSGDGAESSSGANELSGSGDAHAAIEGGPGEEVGDDAASGGDASDAGAPATTLDAATDAAVAGDETAEGGGGDAATDASPAPDGGGGGEGAPDAMSLDATADAGDESPVAEASVVDVTVGDEPDGAGTDATVSVASDGASSDGEADDAVTADVAADGISADVVASDGAPTGDATLAPADAGADAGPCGGCATGFACGTSGYCVTAQGVPAFGHVYVIVMEQQSLAGIQASASSTYTASLIASYALATNYTAPDHPSLPNYIELTSGGTQGVGCDCAPGATQTCTNDLICSWLVGACNCPQAATHLGDELDTAGIEWREYAEGMGTPCNATAVDAGAHFTPSHVPFLYYDDVYTVSARCVARVRDYADFGPDLTSGAYRFSLISPDSCDDMQTSCTGNAILQGDDWLSSNVPAILGTPGFGAGGRDALFVVWEEADTDLGTPPVPLIVVSPLARHVTTAAAYGHYSLLATIEDGLGVPRLGSSAGIAPIADVWR